MTDAEIAKLEQLLCRVWGVMLLADSKVSDPHVKAAFVKVDEEIRRAGLGLEPRPGMHFKETA